MRGWKLSGEGGGRTCLPGVGRCRSIVVPIQAHHPTIVAAADLAIQAIGHAHLIAEAAVVLVWRLIVGEAVNATIRVSRALVAEAATVLVGRALVAEAATVLVG